MDNDAWSQCIEDAYAAYFTFWDALLEWVDDQIELRRTHTLSLL